MSIPLFSSSPFKIEKVQSRVTDPPVSTHIARTVAARIADS